MYRFFHTLIILFFAICSACFSVQAYAQLNLQKEPLDSILVNRQQALTEYVTNPRLLDDRQVKTWFSDISFLVHELERKERDNDSLSVYFHSLVRNHTLFTDAPDKWQPVSPRFMVRFDKGISPAQREQLIEAMQNGERKLRQTFISQLKILPPKGYVFVWIFSTREQFSNLLKTSEETGGLTYYSRFIFLPRFFSYAHSLPQPDIVQFTDTFRHELTHAWINSTTGFPAFTRLPKWFAEGTAIYLGANKKIRISGQSSHSLSDEYNNYYDLFRYLQSDYGKSALDHFISASITSVEAEREFQKLTGGISQQEYFSNKIQLLYLKSAAGIFLICCAFFLFGKLAKKLGRDISGTLLFLLTSLSVLTFFNISGLILFGIHTGFLYLFIFVYLAVLANSGFRFKRWIREKTAAINAGTEDDLKDEIERILERYRFLSEPRKMKTLPLLAQAVVKLDRECFKNNRGEPAGYHRELNDMLDSSPNLRNRSELKDLFGLFTAG